MTEQETQKRKELHKLVECFLTAMTRHPEGNVSPKVSELVRERVTYRATHLKNFKPHNTEPKTLVAIPPTPVQVGSIFHELTPRRTKARIIPSYSLLHFVNNECSTPNAEYFNRIWKI